RSAESTPTRPRSADLPERRSFRSRPGRDRASSRGPPCPPRALLQPRAYGADVPQTPARLRSSRPDLHRMAAQTVDRGEAVLIGGIVADEYGRASAERVLMHEFQHRRALVLARRLDLDDPLAALDAKRLAVFDQQRARQPVRIARQAGRPAIVQRQGESLVFEHETRMAGH